MFYFFFVLSHINFLLWKTLYYRILFDRDDVIFLVILYEHAYLCLRGFNFSSKRIWKENYFWRLNVIHYIWSSKTFLAEHSDLSHSFMTILPWFMFVFLLHCRSLCKAKVKVNQTYDKIPEKKRNFLNSLHFAICHFEMYVLICISTESGNLLM